VLQAQKQHGEHCLLAHGLSGAAKSAGDQTKSKTTHKPQASGRAPEWLSADSSMAARLVVGKVCPIILQGCHLVGGGGSTAFEVRVSGVVPGFRWPPWRDTVRQRTSRAGGSHPASRSALGPRESRSAGGATTASARSCSGATRNEPLREHQIHR